MAADIFETILIESHIKLGWDTHGIRLNIQSFLNCYNLFPFNIFIFGEIVTEEHLNIQVQSPSMMSILRPTTSTRMLRIGRLIPVL